MKTFEEVKWQKKDGDYELVAEALGLSKDTIRSIVNGRRSDNSHVLLAFNILFELREAFPKLVKHHIETGRTQEVDISNFEAPING